MTLTASRVASPDHVSIALARPSLGQAEMDAVLDVLRSGQLAQGARVAEFERAFATYVECEHAIATSNGTTALQLALLAAGVGPGDEVITTPFTFIATVSSILHVGARPVLADIDPHTLNVAPEDVSRLITPRTRAILPVHLYGNPCELDELRDIAHTHGLILIEDACQAHGATYKQRPIGSSGTACFSFYATKNMTCGEGGMICTSDEQLADRARLLRNHGMRSRYVHEALGFNARLSDLHAAVGLVQLTRLEEATRARRHTAELYDAQLVGARRPIVLPTAESAWHQYTLIVEPGRRDAILASMAADGVQGAIYYPVPVHRQPMAVVAGLTGECPNADAAARSVLSIPIHPGLSQTERRYVVDVVNHALAAT
jgi:perosamine synthetase